MAASQFSISNSRILSQLTSHNTASALLHTSFSPPESQPITSQQSPARLNSEAIACVPECTTDLKLGERIVSTTTLTMDTAGDSNPNADPNYVGDFDLVAAPSFNQLSADGESTPQARVTYESLARRPRSNPRTRTPMRYESPLNPNAFRREQPSPERREGLRITVRPLAGAGVGTVLGGRRVSRHLVEESLLMLRPSRNRSCFFAPDS